MAVADCGWGMLFARNVQFESTYPDLGLDPLAKNRHGGRISLLKPDPAVISRKLFTRDQTGMPNCNNGKGTLGKLINDDSVYNNLNSATQRIDSMIAGVQAGHGTLGKLVGNEDLSFV